MKKKSKAKMKREKIVGMGPRQMVTSWNEARRLAADRANF